MEEWPINAHEMLTIYRSSDSCCLKPATPSLQAPPFSEAALPAFRAPLTGWMRVRTAQP